MSTVEPSLRQRKKLRTRRQLIEAAQRLFAEQGYEETTLEQICEEVEISVPTLLNYFPSKDRLAMAAEWDLVDDLRRALSNPDRDADTLSIWRQFVVTGATWAMQNRKAFIKGLNASRQSPTLCKAHLELPSALEDALAEGLANDYGTDALRDLPTRLLATMLAFGNQTVAVHWANDGGRDDLVKLAVSVVDFAIEQFPKPGTPSLGAARRPRKLSAR